MTIAGQTFTATQEAAIPLVNNDSYATPAATPLTIAAPGVLGNDVGSNLTAINASDPAGGTVVLNADGSFTYTPDAGFSGSDSFTYQATNGTNTSAEATVSIAVAVANVPPVANDDTATTPENTALALSAAALTGNDTDSDGGTLSVTAVANPANGAVVLNGSNITFTPAAGYVGAEAGFQYTVSDGQGGSDTASVTITVTEVNVPPTVVNDSRTTAEDTALSIDALSLLAIDSDGDGDLLTVTGVGPASNGTVALNAGTITFNPALNFFGAGSFTYTVSDGKGGTGTGTVSVNITAVNDAPVAADDSYQATVGQPFALNVLANDTDVDGTIQGLQIVAQPAAGATAVVSGIQVSFTATAAGTYTFTYRALDAQLAPSNDATVTVVVGAAAESLTATATYRTRQDRWIVNGTSSLRNAQVIRVTYFQPGSSLDGGLIGTANVTANGTWSVDARGLGLLANGSTQVKVESLATGVSIVVPVTITR